MKRYNCLCLFWTREFSSKMNCYLLASSSEWVRDSSSSSSVSGLLHLFCLHCFRLAAARTISSKFLKLESAGSQPSGKGCWFGHRASKYFLRARWSSSLRMCPKYSQRLSIACWTASSDGDLASSWIDRRVIADSILELMPLTLRFIWSVNNHALEPYISVETIRVLCKRVRVDMWSLVVVSVRRY